MGDSGLLHFFLGGQGSVQSGVFYSVSKMPILEPRESRDTFGYLNIDI